jgi:hypothetical protein
MITKKDQQNWNIIDINGVLVAIIESERAWIVTDNPETLLKTSIYLKEEFEIEVFERASEYDSKLIEELYNSL